ncbi:MAG: FAD-binding oxidoreductase [Sulfobacillus thermotolerans]|nr:FAD-binding oxidoreductase [Sulfobacillus thermotolerans]
MSWVREMATVSSCVHLDDTVARLEIDSPEVARAMKPGQFVMVRPEQSSLLPRAMAPSEWDPEKGRVILYIRIVGPGTQALSALQPGDRLMVIGPLGTPVWPEEGAWALLGRGVGITPLLPMAKELGRRGHDVRIYLSARAQHLLLEADAFAEMGPVTCHVDGQGASSVSLAFIKDLQDGYRPRRVLVCGSRRLTAQVAAWQGVYGYEASVFLEEKMACGIGWCKGCATGPEWHLLCVDGPTRPIEEGLL